MQQQETPPWKAIATTNLLQARKKHGRVGSTKSRSGCLVCKHRRVKCDETRPQCRKCSTTARKCEYAENNVHSGASSQSPPSGEVTRCSSVERLLSPWDLKRGDERTFDFFLSWAAPRLGGSSLDRPYWCGQVLALAQSEPVIVDALLAISILYEHPQFMKSFLTGNEHYATPRDHPAIHSVKRIDEQHASALRYYNRSLMTLRQQVASNKASSLLALVSCMLFTCIEVLRDNVFTALELITNGIKLLDRVKSESSLTLNEGLFKPTRQILVRMSLTAAAFGHWLPIEAEPHHFIMEKSGTFTSMEDARDALFALNQDGHRFLQEAARLWEEVTKGHQSDLIHHQSTECQCVNPKNESDFDVLSYGCSAEAAVTKVKGQEDIIFNMYEMAMHGDGLALKFPLFLRMAGDDLEQRIRDWYHVFVRSGLHVNDDEEAACSLQMLYHVSLVSVAVRMSPMQTAYDDYTHHFREIVRLAGIYNSKKSAERATFTLEVGALAPLWFVILKCRVPSLRRQALSLISTGAKKESVFGAESMGEIAFRIIDFEEEGLGLPAPLFGSVSPSLGIHDDRLPSEEQRIQSLEIIINRPLERFEIRVTRYLIGDEGRLNKKVTDVPL